MKRITALYFFTALVLLAACNGGGSEGNKSGEAIREAHAEDNSTPALAESFLPGLRSEVDDARSMALSPSGVIYVGNRNGNKVYALTGISYLSRGMGRGTAQKKSAMILRW